MRPVQFVLDPIAFVKAQPAPAVPLPCDDVDVAVAVPIDGMRSGNHLRRFALHDRDSLWLSEFRPGVRGAGANVAIEANGVLKMTANQITLAVAVPIHERAQIGTHVTDWLAAKQNWFARSERRFRITANVFVKPIAFVIGEEHILPSIVVPIANEHTRA